MIIICYIVEYYIELAKYYLYLDLRVIYEDYASSRILKLIKTRFLYVKKKRLNQMHKIFKAIIHFFVSSQLCVCVNTI